MDIINSLDTEVEILIPTINLQPASLKDNEKDNIIGSNDNKGNDIEHRKSEIQASMLYNQQKIHDYKNQNINDREENTFDDDDKISKEYVRFKKSKEQNNRLNEEKNIN